MITPDHADVILAGVCKFTGADGAMLIIFGGDPDHAFSAHITNTVHPLRVLRVLKRLTMDLEEEVARRPLRAETS